LKYSFNSIKTTLVEALTGVWAARHSEELKRGITIKLGYAETPIYRCSKCDHPGCYSTKKICPFCDSPTEFLRAVSFVDAPGHEALMATMLSGASVMDGAILIISADEPCPQPQTREHLAAIEIVGITKIVIVQNKIDIIDKERAQKSYQEIVEFVKGTIAEDAPIIPISAQHSVNIDYLIQALEERIPTPVRDPIKPPQMYVVRSFDINKPGTSLELLKGGVIGGTLIQGSFKMNDELEISPGIRVEYEGKTNYEPLFTNIVSLHAGGKTVDEAHSGGLLGIGTLLDPSLTKADGLIGNLVGKPNMLPPIRTELTLTINLFDIAVGTKEMKKVDRVTSNERVLLHVGTTITVGTVISVSGDSATIRLGRPVCAEKGSRVALSRRIAARWRLIGYGIIE
jgi:translation initiation factor 2 subunit 3